VRKSAEELEDFGQTGTVESLSRVSTVPNDDAVHIWSNYKEVVGETWAGPGCSYGDKYARNPEEPGDRRDVHSGYGSRENDLIEKRPVRNV